MNINTKAKSWHSTALAAILLFCIIGILSYNVGYKKGWDKGANDMFKATTDTVITICKKQIRTDKDRYKCY